MSALALVSAPAAAEPVEHTTAVRAVPPVTKVPPAARILAEVFPEIVGFDATGMTSEEVHYFLGESAGVAYYQYQVLVSQP